MRKPPRFLEGRIAPRRLNRKTRSRGDSGPKLQHCIIQPRREPTVRANSAGLREEGRGPLRAVGLGGYCLSATEVLLLATSPQNYLLSRLATSGTPFL